MRNRHKHVSIKVLLVLLTELMLVITVNLTSRYIIDIPKTQSNYIYVVLGGILALLVVNYYNRMIARRKREMYRKIQDLESIALQRRIGEPIDKEEESNKEKEGK